MRGIVLKAVLFLLLQLLLIGWVVRSYRPNPEIFWAGTVEKHRLLAAPGPPRLVFVGGSNLAFSLDSQLVAEELPYRPVNMGLDAALGLDFLLNEVAGKLRPGDVVVLSPEYQLFLGWRRGQVFSLARVLEQRPASAAHLSAGNVATLLDRGFSFFHWVFVSARKDLDRKPITGPYSAAAFNGHGDAVGHLDKASKGERIPRTLEEVWRAGRFDAAARSSLERFHRACQERGVRVFLSHPPLPDYYSADSPPVRKVQAEIYGRTTIPSLEGVDDMFFPLEGFYDTEYHLLREARTERTRRVVARLEDKLLDKPPRKARKAVTQSVAQTRFSLETPSD